MGDADKAQIAEAETRLGRVLRGKWRLDELLGAGGMAAVYAATHRNGKRAAVKVLRPEVALLSDVKSRFLRDISIYSQQIKPWVCASAESLLPGTPAGSGCNAMSVGVGFNGVEVKLGDALAPPEPELCPPRRRPRGGHLRAGRRRLSFTRA